MNLLLRPDPTEESRLRKRIYDRARYQDNPEKLRAKTKEWRRANRERALETNRTYNKAHLSERSAHNQAYMERRKIWLAEFKKSHSCELCGESHPSCIDFHHRTPEAKRFGIGENSKGKCLKTLQAEIAKCQILCANCHRKIHWEEK